MLNQATSNKLWQALETHADTSREYFFSSKVQDAGIRVETFSIWKRLNSGRREKKRDYYRFTRDATGSVLYDQLEDVKEDVSIPEVRISPNRANKLLVAALIQQREIDTLRRNK